MKRILVIDTETGGLDPSNTSILSLGAVILENNMAIAEKEFFIREDPVIVSLEAYKVNKIELSELSKVGLPPCKVVEELNHWLTYTYLGVVTWFNLFEDYLLAGHNIHFDIGYLQRLYRLAGKTYPFNYRVIDTITFAALLQAEGRAQKANLDSLLDYYGIIKEERHTALGDAKATAKVLQAFQTKGLFGKDYGNT